MRFLSSGFRCAGKRAETKLEKFFGFFLHKAKLCATFASPNLRERHSQRTSHDFGPTGRGGHVERVVPWDIELWCNGNTTDSGPVFPGSSPGSSTRRPVKHRLTGLHFLSDRSRICACMQRRFPSLLRMSPERFVDLFRKVTAASLLQTAPRGGSCAEDVPAPRARNNTKVVDFFVIRMSRDSENRAGKRFSVPPGSG